MADYELAYKTIPELTLETNVPASGDWGLRWDTSANKVVRYAAENLQHAIGITATVAELNYLDITTVGTAEATKALILDSDKNLIWTATSASTNGGTSVEPIAFTSTMTGTGGVGGRAKFALAIEAVLGGWSNALKGIATYNSSGRTTGLGSAVLAELSLEANTTVGTYAALEAEIVMPSGASTGTGTSFLYMNVGGADKATFDTSGFLFEIGAGITAGNTKFFASEAKTTIGKTHTLKVKIAGATYYIALHTSQAFGGS